MTSFAAALGLALVAQASTETATSTQASGPIQQSILPMSSYRLDQRLHTLPLLGSYHLALEQIIQPVVFQVEESP